MVDLCRSNVIRKATFRIGRASCEGVKRADLEASIRRVGRVENQRRHAQQRHHRFAAGRDGRLIGRSDGSAQSSYSKCPIGSKSKDCRNSIHVTHLWWVALMHPTHPNESSDVDVAILVPSDCTLLCCLYLAVKRGRRLLRGITMRDQGR